MFLLTFIYFTVTRMWNIYSFISILIKTESRLNEVMISSREFIDSPVCLFFAVALLSWEIDQIFTSLANKYYSGVTELSDCGAPCCIFTHVNVAAILRVSRCRTHADNNGARAGHVRAQELEH